MILIDTDVLIEHLRGSARATIFLEKAVDPHISVLTRFELLGGMRSDERHAVRSLVTAVPNLTVTADISTRAGEWARQHRRSHRNIGPIDYLIAATAEAHGAELATMNLKHYPMFPGLTAPF